MLILAELNPYLVKLGIVALVGVCVLMILVVLIQRPQGGGLSGAFGAGGGGAGAGQTAFGTKTGDVLTYATIAVFVLYLLVAIGLNFATRPYTDNANTLPAATAPGAPEQQSDGGAETETTGDTAGDTAGDGAGDEAPQEDVTGPAGDPAGGVDPSEPGTPSADVPETDPAVDPASAEQP